MPTVRPFASGEWRAYRDLRLRALADAPDAFATTLAAASARSDADWEAQLEGGVASERDLPLAAERGGALVGMAWCRLEEDGSAQLIQMWVSPEARGCGAGRALLDAALVWLRRNGARLVDLDVTRGNAAAERLYTRAGFRPRGEPAPLRPGSPVLAQPVRLVLEAPPSRPRRSSLDRLMRLAAPRPVAGHAPPPRELAPGLWGVERLLRLPGGLRLPSRSTLVRRADGGLVLISPPPLLDPDAIAALGDVRQVVAPNTFHYVFAREVMERLPEASLVVAPGLVDRAPELPPARELGAEPPPEWSGTLECSVLGPVRGVSEVVLFHVPSGSLLLTDLAFHLVRFDRAFDRIGWRLSGMPAGFGPGRTSRLMLLRDREAAARCLRRAAEWPIRRIVVAHGEIVEDDAAARFREAFADYLEGEAATS